MVKLSAPKSAQCRLARRSLQEPASAAGGRPGASAPTPAPQAASKSKLQQPQRPSSQRADSICTVSHVYSALNEKPARGAPTADATIDGLSGRFSPVRNDFTPMNKLSEDEDDIVDYLNGQQLQTSKQNGRHHFRDHPGWDRREREKVKRFRFVVASMGLVALALGFMSRMILNVAIVEMTEGVQAGQPAEGELGGAPDANATAAAATLAPTTTFPDDTLLNGPNSLAPHPATTTLLPPHLSSSLPALEEESAEGSDAADGLHFNWSVGEQNFLLASFYIGYAPSMLFGGSLADRYGAKYPLLVATLGSSIVNLMTPTLARTSLPVLTGSRVLIGALQGSIVPALYDLFNKWLTLTEASIFTPMIKVSMALGAFIGTMLPGLLVSLGFEWPFMFYAGSLMCALWSLLWLSLATSTPQTNRLVRANELERITRKKAPPARQQQLAAPERKRSTRSTDSQAAARPATPWWLIVSCPSVLALTLVKFTYNLGMDFMCLELAVYLRQIHGASMETISAIAGVGCFMQVLLVTFIGWLARVLIRRSTFGWSRTQWRKAFQGSSNFAMALAYLCLAQAGARLSLVSFLTFAIFFFWMLGAGGESMVPYDLTTRYPATIMGLAHSVSILSGLAMPWVTSLILGDSNTDPERWNLLFMFISAALGLGGLVFVLLLKSKPFLPGEREASAGCRAKGLPAKDAMSASL